MKAKEWAPFLLRRFAVRMAVFLTMVAGGFVVLHHVLPRMAITKAKERAREAGLELVVKEAEVRLWEIRLHGVRVSGPRAEVQAETVTVEYDSRLRTGAITVDKADALLKERREKSETVGRRSDISLTNSRVRTERGGARVSAEVRKARISPEGKIWADADAHVDYGRYSIEAKGVRTEGTNPESAEMTAESVVVKVGKKLPEEDQKDPPEVRDPRKRRKVSIRSKTASVEGEMSGNADNILISVEAFSWGEEVHMEADYASVSGNSASIVSADATRWRDNKGFLKVRASAESVDTGNKRLSKSDFSIRKLEVRGSIVETVGGTMLTAADVRVGEAQAGVEAYLGRPGGANPYATLKMEMPEVGCQALLESLPRELVPVLLPEKGGTTRLSGKISWKLEVSVDLPDRKKPDVSIWLRNKCTVDEVPEKLNVLRLQKPFRHEEYSADGTRTTEAVGPGTRDWVPLTAISPLMPMSVMAMEDPSFMTHRGILIEAIENSMEQNIVAGKFVRGGSTISMQLAKNLWLAREKTLSRKIQEAFLTTYLEQKMTKQKMIELYLNVVEFGPNLYGIGPAAHHYFAKEPGSLTLSQSLFLASLLPSPKSAGYEEGKKVSQGRLDLLRKVMKMMLDRGTISGSQYEQGMRETPVFGEPSAVGEIDPGPRAPGGIDPSEWR